MKMCANWLLLERALGSLFQSFLFEDNLSKITSISRSSVIWRRTDPKNRAARTDSTTMATQDWCFSAGS